MIKEIGIAGHGWVGKAMHQLFPAASVYDPNVKEFAALENKERVKKADISFVCVPTPCLNRTRLDTSAVEEVVNWLESDLIVIRSTLNPGDADALTHITHKRICVQPEYLGETPAHPMSNMKDRQFMVIGGDRKDREKLIELYSTVYNSNVSIRQVTNYAAEIIKLTENRAIAWKVAQMQELYDVCKAHDIDYYTVRDVVYGDDPRFNLWWTFIYPDKRGFNSKCIPKDVYAWCAWAESAGYTPKITRGILDKNQEWLDMNPKENDAKV